MKQSKGDNNYGKEACFNAWSILFVIDIREWSQFWKAWREFEA